MSPHPRHDLRPLEQPRGGVVVGMAVRDEHGEDLLRLHAF